MPCIAVSILSKAWRRYHFPKWEFALRLQEGAHLRVTQRRMLKLDNVEEYDNIPQTMQNAWGRQVLLQVIALTACQPQHSGAPCW